jgi:hypothetical protein
MTTWQLLVSDESGVTCDQCAPEDALDRAAAAYRSTAAADVELIITHATGQERWKFPLTREQEARYYTLAVVELLSS